MFKTPRVLYLDDFCNANDRNLDFLYKIDISLRNNQFWKNILCPKGLKHFSALSVESILDHKWINFQT